MILFTDISHVLRNFFSTDDSCLSYLNNKIATGFESDLHTGMILINLQKAFDTANQKILLKKMELIGFSEEKAKWFKSYLSNRKFKVHIQEYFLRDCKPPMWSSSRIYFRTTPFSFIFKLYATRGVDCELLLLA